MNVAFLKNYYQNKQISLKAQIKRLIVIFFLKLCFQKADFKIAIFLLKEIHAFQISWIYVIHFFKDNAFCLYYYLLRQYVDN